ncbi:MAG: hypothetical protein WA652_18260, partial [Xanthobacteraceae bacterium]
METTAARVGRGEDPIRRHVQRALRELMTANRPHTKILTVPWWQAPLTLDPFLPVGIRLDQTGIDRKGLPTNQP